MMKYLFILNDFYPLKNASGACVEKIIDLLINKGEEVHVLCAFNENLEIKDENLIIHTVSTTNNQTANGRDINSLYENKLKRFISYFKYLKSYPIQFPQDASLYFKEASYLVKKYSITKVVGVIHPIESAVVLPKIKELYPHIQVIVYEIDSIGDLDNRSSLYRSYFNHRRRLIERHLYGSSDRIIYMKCHEAYFSNERFDKYRHKMFMSDFPMYTPRVSPRKGSFKRDVINFVFSGSLYSSVREPISIIDILKCVSERYSIRCSFFSKGNYEDYLAQQEEVSNGVIMRCGYVDNKIVEKEYENADILISIGNMMPNMVPSKIYAYMSYGKPILHISAINDDPCNEILSHYPLALVVNTNDDIIFNVKKVSEFINTIKAENTHIVPEGLFPMNRPEYTVQLINYE